VMDQSQDLGNICLLEHVNLSAPDAAMASLFYLDLLGLSQEPRDPKFTTMWMNIGRQQFHVGPSKEAEVVDGEIGVLVPSLDTLISRIKSFPSSFADTKFQWSISSGIACDFYVPAGYSSKVVSITCPWGNQFRIYDASDPFIKNMTKGIIYLLLNCEQDSLSFIEDYYSKYFSMEIAKWDAHTLSLRVGPWQHLIFREKPNHKVQYNGFHICFYIQQFSSCYRKLSSAGLLALNHRFNDKCDTLEESLKNSQFRTLDIPLATGTFQLMQEVRSCYHPSFYKNWRDV